MEMADLQIRLTLSLSGCSNSIRGNGSLRKNSQKISPIVEPTLSNRHGRQYFQTRDYYLCCGKCTKAILTCCPHISTEIRQRQHSETLLYENHSTRERAKISNCKETEIAKCRTRATTVQRGIYYKRTIHCPCSTATTRWPGAGWLLVNPRACVFAKTQRSWLATTQGSYRMLF